MGYFLTSIKRMQGEQFVLNIFSTNLLGYNGVQARGWIPLLYGMRTSLKSWLALPVFDQTMILVPRLLLPLETPT